MNGNGAFNGHILVDKLAKLNNSQQSIETLSHWCIFHRKKARQVVETWERQFYCSPRDQRVSFLHLANDILQNSKRKGPEFVGEFWKVLPDALNDVIESGDEFGRKAVLRLVDIWEERKVFGNRPRTVKEELLGRTSENRNRNGKTIRYKLKQPAGEMLEKLISSFEHVYDAHIDEDTLFSKCGTAISFLENVEKEIGGDLGNIKGSGVVEELQGQHGILRECIEQLKLTESSRAILISQLREALQEQEFKIQHIHNQLQAAQSRYEQAGTVFSQLLPPLDQKLKEQPPPPPPPPSSAFSDVVPPPPGFSPESPGTGTPVRYTQQQQRQQSPLPADITHSPHTSEGEHRKTAAAAVAAKLTSSTSSAQMLSYVLSSLASEGVIGQQMKEDSPSDGSKRIKVDNGSVSVPSYVPQPSSQPPLPPFPHPDSLHQPPPPSSPMAHQPPPPPLPTMPPMPPPPPPSGIGGQFMQAGPMTGVPFSYGSMPPIMPGYSMVGMPPFPGPPNPYQSLQGPDNAGPFVQPPMPAIPPPMSRQ